MEKNGGGRGEGGAGFFPPFVLKIGFYINLYLLDFNLA